MNELRTRNTSAIRIVIRINQNRTAPNKDNEFHITEVVAGKAGPARKAASHPHHGGGYAGA